MQKKGMKEWDHKKGPSKKMTPSFPCVGRVFKRRLRSSTGPKKSQTQNDWILLEKQRADCHSLFQ